MVRFLGLYLRSRQVPVAFPLALAGVLAVTLLGDDQRHPSRSVIFAILGLVLGVAVAGPGLGGPSGELDRTAALNWVRWRAGHAIAITALVFGTAFVATHVPAGLLLRDAAGLAGLGTLAAAAFGHHLAWTLPVTWGGLAAVVPPMAQPVILRVATWPSQPPEDTTAAVTAAVLAVAGLVVYARGGSRT
ncbi:hypothetical protein [Amycolatopsis pigmentata]|uniref:Uncharacterized protein n=1 Tax=Amycolatopsis pigmentata TaxID=450801 RepID=A0ABW5G4A8_9PSEU